PARAAHTRSAGTARRQGSTRMPAPKAARARRGGASQIGAASSRSRGSRVPRALRSVVERTADSASSLLRRRAQKPLRAVDPRALVHSWDTLPVAAHVRSHPPMLTRVPSLAPLALASLAAAQPLTTLVGGADQGGTTAIQRQVVCRP